MPETFLEIFLEKKPTQLVTKSWDFLEPKSQNSDCQISLKLGNIPENFSRISEESVKRTFSHQVTKLENLGKFLTVVTWEWCADVDNDFYDVEDKAADVDDDNYDDDDNAADVDNDTDDDDDNATDFDDDCYYDDDNAADVNDNIMMMIIRLLILMMIIIICW